MMQEFDECEITYLIRPSSVPKKCLKFKSFRKVVGSPVPPYLNCEQMMCFFKPSNFSLTHSISWYSSSDSDSNSGSDSDAMYRQLPTVSYAIYNITIS